MEEIKAEEKKDVTQQRDLNESDLEYFMNCGISTIDNFFKGLIDCIELDGTYNSRDSMLFIARDLVNNFRKEMDEAFEAINNQVGVILLKQNPRHEGYGFKARLEKK